MTCQPCQSAIVLAAVLLLSGPSRAQVIDPRDDEAVVTASGQSTAIAMACGKIDRAAAALRRADLLKRFASKGMAAATFARLYDTALDGMTATTKANPAATKAGCERLGRLGAEP
ncbi:hypothetical protein NS228_15475 [Methylobacterium indicum]|uniref:hypothetical protein n=1 Tax=Methylobacterium indicum TaxID=1775910 RepID=UPI000734A6A4|nr:hypothetical protein [Methylobacterium indicum]KTS30519.1 hypothetical protein NS229_15910 [Methylobacterium indicum]KTS39400.1 hypothetical protein NS228_15475 [Methylobacterium indicum]KTS49989.1 hypothetical protein NS230_16930 [Methylobacterium indicum]